MAFPRPLQDGWSSLAPIFHGTIYRWRHISLFVMILMQDSGVGDSFGPSIFCATGISGQAHQGAITQLKNFPGASRFFCKSLVCPYKHVDSVEQLPVMSQAVAQGLKDPSSRVIQNHFATSDNLGDISAKVSKLPVMWSRVVVVR